MKVMNIEKELDSERWSDYVIDEYDNWDIEKEKFILRRIICEELELKVKEFYFSKYEIIEFGEERMGKLIDINNKTEINIKIIFY